MNASLGLGLGLVKGLAVLLFAPRPNPSPGGAWCAANPLDAGDAPAGEGEAAAGVLERPICQGAGEPRRVAVRAWRGGGEIGAVGEGAVASRWRQRIAKINCWREGPRRGVEESKSASSLSVLSSSSKVLS